MRTSPRATAPGPCAASARRRRPPGPAVVKTGLPPPRAVGGDRRCASRRAPVFAIGCQPVRSAGVEAQHPVANAAVRYRSATHRVLLHHRDGQRQQTIGSGSRPWSSSRGAAVDAENRSVSHRRCHGEPCHWFESEIGPSSIPLDGIDSWMHRMSLSAPVKGTKAVSPGPRPGSRSGRCVVAGRPEEAVGPGHVGDAGEPEFLQALLQGAEHALRAPPLPRASRPGSLEPSCARARPTWVGVSRTSPPCRRPRACSSSGWRGRRRASRTGPWPGSPRTPPGSSTWCPLRRRRRPSRYRWSHRPW